jgi:hypothetical protein
MTRGIGQSIKDGKKQCSTCKEWKPLSDFRKDYRSTSKYESACRLCTPIRRLLGVTGKEYAELLLKQNGVCAICKKEETRISNGIVTSLSVDHCHDTNKIRGLLCNKCNTAIGQLNHSIEVLLSAIEYLRRSR